MTNEQTRDGHSEVLADHSTEDSEDLESVRWGSEAQATHCREGEAGYNVSLEGTMGDTQRSQTISTEFQGIAQQEDEPAMGGKVMRQSGCRLIG